MLQIVNPRYSFIFNTILYENLNLMQFIYIYIQLHWRLIQQLPRMVGNENYSGT